MSQVFAKGPERQVLPALFSSVVSYAAMKRPMRARWLPVGPLVLFGFMAAAVSCSKEEPPPTIRVRESDLIVQNQTAAAWSNVEVWVNDHYRGVASSLQPGQQLTVPLNALEAAYGQRFDRSRQPVFGVLVTARSADGTSVRLTWGKVGRR